MTTASRDNPQALTDLEPILQRLRSRLGRLGLSVAAFDCDGKVPAEFQPAPEFCRTLCDADAPCRCGLSELSAEVAESGEAGCRHLPEAGCCVLAVPIRRRRRVIGTAVACYPTEAWRDEEFLARRCDALGLDRQAMTPLAEAACRHRPEDMEDLLRTFEWLLAGEKDLHVANDELVTLSKNLTTTYEELSLLYAISGSMRVTQQPRDFLDSVCRELREVMSVSAAAAVVYAHRPATNEDLVVTRGEPSLTESQVQRLVATQVSPLVGRNTRPTVDNEFMWATEPELDHAVRNLIAVPLVGERPLGMLLAMNKREGDFNSVDIKLVSSIGNQAAVFLTNNMLYADLQDLLMGVLHALTATIDAKDPYTCGHSHRVAMISRRLAAECGLEPARVQLVYLAGLLHDIGKIGVPESTLCKPGRLTDEEYDAIKKHPRIGAKILGGIRQLDDVIPGILCHHERLDGRGYPQGLTGADIPQEARIIGLADCFDAMTSDRIYRKALPLETVISEIREHAGTQFDPDVAQKMLSLDLESYLEELRKPARPVVSVTLAQEGRR